MTAPDPTDRPRAANDVSVATTRRASMPDPIAPQAPADDSARHTLAPSSTPQVASPSATITTTAERTVAVKSTAQMMAETTVDLAALAIIGAALLMGKIAGPYLQGGAILGILLLAGVRVADILALSKGLPSRGGPASLVVAAGGSVAAWLSSLTSGGQS